MLKKILIGLAVVVVALAGFIAMRPSTYHVERSLTVQAPPELVHGIVADMARFPSFSPWHKLDPTMKQTLSPTTTGVGATYAWESPKDDVGSGTMTITAVEPNQKVVQDLHFLKPWESKAVVTFTTTAEGTGTKVTWGMDGDTGGFVGKAMGLFMDMDAMIGKDFEEGLTNLSRVSLEEAVRQGGDAKGAGNAAAAAAGGAPGAPGAPGAAPGAPGATGGEGGAPGAPGAPGKG